MYREGFGVAQSDAEAVKWYRKSAEQGNVFGQNNLGWMYEKGRGVGQSGTEAVKWYRKSAGQGNEWAQSKLEERGIDWTASDRKAEPKQSNRLIKPIQISKKV